MKDGSYICCLNNEIWYQVAMRIYQGSMQVHFITHFDTEKRSDKESNEPTTLAVTCSQKDITGNRYDKLEVPYEKVTQEFHKAKLNRGQANRKSNTATSYCLRNNKMWK